MTGDEYVAASKRLRMTRDDRLDLFQISDRTDRRYANGHGEVPFVIAALLRCMIKQNLTPSDVKRIVNQK